MVVRGKPVPLPLRAAVIIGFSIIQSRDSVVASGIVIGGEMFYARIYEHRLLAK
jgi:hypothetical protein